MCGVLIAGCAERPTDLTQERIYAMATWVDISIRDVDSAAATVAIGEIELLLGAFERDYYAWAPGELADLNAQLHAGESASVSVPMATLLRDAQRLSTLSDGYFEPGLGSLVELWGFHSSIAARPSPPSGDQIQSYLGPQSRIASVRIDGQRITSDSRELTLDLGGIAKGAAVDSIIRLLIEKNVEHALVNAGGDLRVIGRSGGRTDQRRWRVGIRHPREIGLLGIIELTGGEAAFTSGDYERFYDHEGTRLHHILDPLTGRPVTHTQAVTVIAADGTTADAAATALFAAGPDRWRELADALGIASVLRVNEDGNIDLTEPMRERLIRAGGDDSDIMTPPDQDGPV
jgi:thiamine biosynthesis lipoprotein